VRCGKLTTLADNPEHGLILPSLQRDVYLPLDEVPVTLIAYIALIGPTEGSPVPKLTAQLVLQELDERTLPAVSSVLPWPVLTHEVTVTVSQPKHTLQGSASGHYIGNLLMVDAGVVDKLTGTAKLKNLGAFNLTGVLQGVGFIFQGHATGQLVLSSTQGTITLTLRGPVESGFQPLPSTFSYRISAATGAYQHMTGTGHVTVKLIPAPTAFGLPPQGLFQLTIS
jgi:hypothetical protein